MKMQRQLVQPPRLLWFDLTQDQSAQDHIGIFANSCSVHLARDLKLGEMAEQRRADMICMHYDHPDSLSLNLLIELKRAVPSTPITMLTTQHSEELAVWAFRSGVWDYLVLPLQQSERTRYLKALHDLCHLRREEESPELKQPLRRIPELPDSVRLTASHRTLSPLNDALRYIEAHFREPIEQKELAKRCCMTPFRFSRLFKQTYGLGFLEFVQHKRMQEAELLLTDSDMCITSIAYALGFQDPSYFSRIFKRSFGCSPSDYRRDGPPPQSAKQDQLAPSARP